MTRPYDTSSPALLSSRQWRTAAWVGANVPLRCTRITESQSASVMPQMVASRAMPALLTTMSRRPNSSMAWATMRAAPSTSATSS